MVTEYDNMNTNKRLKFKIIKLVSNNVYTYSYIKCIIS